MSEEDAAKGSQLSPSGMRTLLKLILALQCGFLGGTASGQELDTLVYQPPTGVDITRTVYYSEATECISESKSGGIELNIHPGRQALTREDRYVIRDSIVSLIDGQPKEFQRTFVDLSSSWTKTFPGPAKPGHFEWKYRSRLQGRTVGFRWDGETGQYVNSLGDNQEESTVSVKGLVEDMDLRVLLPPSGRAKPGDKWKVDLTGDVLPPWEELHFDIIYAGEEDSSEFSSWKEMIGFPADKVECVTNCVYNGHRTEEGTRVGMIGLKMDIERTSRRKEEILVNQRELYHLEGELVWGIVRGRMLSLLLDGTVSRSQSYTYRMGRHGEQQTDESVYSGGAHLEMHSE